MVPDLLVIVPCGQKKVWDRNPKAGPTLAQNVYTGSPFVVNRAYAGYFGEQWLILSAKYGFIKRDFQIPGPYNITFKKRTTKPVSSRELQRQVRRLKLDQFSMVIGLGGKDYRQAMTDAFQGTSVKLHFPFAGLQVGKMMQATKRAMAANQPLGSPTPNSGKRSATLMAKETLSRLPQIEPDSVAVTCQQLHLWLKGFPKLKVPFDVDQIPRNGIYVLFENGEVGHQTDRIVRVGTHTGPNQLRSRLAQHFLNEHKDRSIFRKNIGRCFLKRDNDPFLAWWELDLTTRIARKTHAGRIDIEKQKEVENRVSGYMSERFTFVVFEVPDKYERLELESKITSTVSLCNDCGPSSAWLGSNSPKRKIQKSGLWQENELWKTPLSRNDLLELQKCVSQG